jgi:hypothetical protein
MIIDICHTRPTAFFFFPLDRVSTGSARAHGVDHLRSAPPLIERGQGRGLGGKTHRKDASEETTKGIAPTDIRKADDTDEVKKS